MRTRMHSGQGAIEDEDLGLDDDLAIIARLCMTVFVLPYVGDYHTVVA